MATKRFKKRRMRRTRKTRRRGGGKEGKEGKNTRQRIAPYYNPGNTNDRFIDRISASATLWNTHEKVDNAVRSFKSEASKLLYDSLKINPEDSSANSLYNKRIKEIDRIGQIGHERVDMAIARAASAARAVPQKNIEPEPHLNLSYNNEMKQWNYDRSAVMVTDPSVNGYNNHSVSGSNQSELKHEN